MTVLLTIPLLGIFNAKRFCIATLEHDSVLELETYFGGSRGFRVFRRMRLVAWRETTT